MPNIFENPNFTFSKDSSGTNSLGFQIVSSKNNSVILDIFLESDGIRIDIDGISEAFEWSNKDIKNSKEKVAKLIKYLFTGYILIETQNASRFIQIFDAEGFFIRSFSRNNSLHFYTGLYIFRYKTYRRLFLPMFEKKN